MTRRSIVAFSAFYVWAVMRAGARLARDVQRYRA